MYIHNLYRLNIAKHFSNNNTNKIYLSTSTNVIVQKFRIYYFIITKNSYYYTGCIKNYT